MGATTVHSFVLHLKLELQSMKDAG